MTEKKLPGAGSQISAIISGIILLSLGIALTVSWFNRGIAFQLLGPEFSASQRIACLKQLFERCGMWAPVAYVGFVMVEVIIAPIPGILLYAPGGLLFGPFLGGLLAIIGNMLGAGVSCGLTRSLGAPWVNRMFSGASSRALQESLQNRGGWLIFLLRLNPMTSSDILSYAAGFTHIPPWKVAVATGCGMAPLCFGQAWLSDSLFNTFPQLIYPLLILSAGYLIAVIVIVRRLLKPSDSGQVE